MPYNCTIACGNLIATRHAQHCIINVVYKPFLPKWSSQKQTLTHSSIKSKKNINTKLLQRLGIVSKSKIPQHIIKNKKQFTQNSKHNVINRHR